MLFDERNRATKMSKQLGKEFDRAGEAAAEKLKIDCCNCVDLRQNKNAKNAETCQWCINTSCNIF